MTESQRNLLILVALAVVGVLFSGAFSIGAGILGVALNLAFTILIIAFLVILYRRNAGTIAAMPVTPRLVMQISGIVMAIVLFTGMLAAPFLPTSIFGWSARQPVLFWGLVLASGFGMWWSWQQRSNRW